MHHSGSARLHKCTLSLTDVAIINSRPCLQPECLQMDALFLLSAGSRRDCCTALSVRRCQTPTAAVHAAGVQCNCKCTASPTAESTSRRWTASRQMSTFEHPTPPRRPTPAPPKQVTIRVITQCSAGKQGDLGLHLPTAVPALGGGQPGNARLTSIRRGQAGWRCHRLLIWKFILL